MIEIKDLLVKFGGILLVEEDKKESVRKVISKVIKFEIPPDAIEIRNNVIYLKIKPIFKNEIFLKQDMIVSELREKFGGKTPSGIR